MAKAAKATRKKPAPAAAERRIPYNLRVLASHLKRAEALAERKGVTVAAIVQIALAEKLEREENAIKPGTDQRR